MSPQPLLSIEQVSKHFGGVRAVHACSLTLPPSEHGRGPSATTSDSAAAAAGDAAGALSEASPASAAGGIFGLIGPNGSGKTTLFNLITGLYRIDAGRIRFRGRRIDGHKPHQIARAGIARTFQIIRVFPELTAFENLLVATDDHRAEATRDQAEELLELVSLAHLRNEYAANLSYGQQKLLEFARCLMRDPRLILLDEPAAGVNRTLLNSLIEHIARLSQRGKTIFIVEHDMKVVMELCDSVFVLDQGELIAQGPPAEIQRDERVIAAYFGS
ncbi:MAG: ABC transporter ATP-binding protein [Candidatus Tectomicrobia bacterium]|nr:ABC transporter ATP-binding protein [Candidatus Tectomicrobia bacterium]